jgi:16S rRNA (guanine1207-N2)-methyltransferase
VNGHKREMRYIIAQSTKWLKSDGHIILAGANDSGGKTLAKLCDEYGFIYHEIAKHKHRIFHIYDISKISVSVIESAITDGLPQQRQDGLWSQPGIFSWDETDKGSAVFLNVLSSENFLGNGADFGCGIGVLGHYLLSAHNQIIKLDSIDMDIRATSCAVKNLEQFGARSHVLHGDATTYLSPQKYDFVISNPPFHTGRDVSIKLGQSFITNAAKNLKQSGYFYMVANQSLPYEVILQQYFTNISLLITAKGFKIYKAQK